MSAEHTVLLVDDSAFAQKVISQYLEGTEFKIVATAKSGGEAVEQYKTHSPDICMLDVILPDQDGAATLKQIMEINPEATVIMVSSLGTENTVTDCLALGAKNFVQKPVDKETLLSHMREVTA